MRREQQNSLDQIFKNSLDQLEEIPNPKVWKKIDQELNKKEKGLVWFPFSARLATVVVSLMTIGFMAGYFYSNHANQNRAELQSHPTNISHSETKQGIQEKDGTESAIGLSSVEKEGHNSKQQQINPSTITDSKKQQANQAHKSSELQDNQQDNMIPKMDPIRVRKTKRINSGNQPLWRNNRTAAESNPPIANDAPVVDKKQEEKVFITKNNQTIELQIIGEKEVSTAMKEDVSLTEKPTEIEFNQLRKKVTGATGFFVGPNIGLNTSNLYFSKQTTDPIFNNASKFTLAAGYSFGVLGGYDFNSKLGILSGINFTRYNFGFHQVENDSKNEGELSIFQIEVPLVLRYKWNMEVGKKKRLMTLAALGGMKYSYVTKYYMAARLFSQRANDIAYWHLDKLSSNENHQLGYILGVEANYFVKKNWYIYFNLTSAISTDISQFPIFLNNQLEKPSQLSISTNMGVRFQFNRNKKTTKR